MMLQFLPGKGELINLNEEDTFEVVQVQHCLFDDADFAAENWATRVDLDRKREEDWNSI
ncbi:MAG: hypothetical protein ACI8UO_005399 [Verrucomicrobiales bacterium]|jgi:hypothetical protein